MTAIVWLRDDLRVADNPALVAGVEHARATGESVAVVFILDEVSAGIRPLGGATKWWLHHSLEALQAKIARLGGTLTLRRGPAFDVMRTLLRESGASAVFWNRRYGGVERELDAQIKEYAQASGLLAQSFQANLLFEPWTVRTGAGTPYTVFTPFWKSCLAQPEPPRAPLPAPDAIPGAGSVPAVASPLPSDELASWMLLPSSPDWAQGLRLKWQVGENAAQERLEHFIAEGLNDYAEGRDFPARHATSELSPHLRFGEISPFQVRHRIEQVLQSAATGAGVGVGKSSADLARNAAKFLAEVGWREFSYHLLFHWPDLATRNFDSRFDSFPWGPADPGHLRAWQEGRTGIPLVDAGMRELWQTGTMHNRVRMVTASFLVKNLLIDWRVGEQWFWDTLVDADAANNAASWQWVAGSGADAAPYFRVFNPVLQGEKFDPDGQYRRTYLGDFEHPLSSGYPYPIVDLAASRARALEAFEALSGVPRAIRPPA
jgi:deoxyribodipyrimidine photo-lyase